MGTSRNVVISMELVVLWLEEQKTKSKNNGEGSVITLVEKMKELEEGT